jgi:superfamily I DNA/RNA helicase
MKLDTYQEAAVHTDYPYVLVAASAGSGKTRIITERIKFLLANGYEASNIYAITYTNAAAEEMRSRIDKDTRCYIGTIHGLANRILLQNGINTDWFLQTENYDMLFEQFYDRKDDIILPQVDYLLIDEFQDICDNEYDFIFNILRPSEYMAVGDSAQAIYSFKGSNFAHFMDMVKNPNIKVYELSNCYRCGYEIIDFAETFLYSVDDIYKIPSYCANKKMGNVVKDTFSIDNLINEIEFSPYEYKDIFVLVRSNKEIDELTTILESTGISSDTFKKSDLDSGSLNELLQKNSVKILTAHSAKGLEAKKVIVCAFKLWNNEEKRLAYVAATRASDELVWLNTKPKNKRGRAKKIEMIEW